MSCLVHATGRAGWRRSARTTHRRRCCPAGPVSLSSSAGETGGRLKGPVLEVLMRRQWSRVVVIGVAAGTLGGGLLAGGGGAAATAKPTPLPYTVAARPWLDAE